MSRAEYEYERQQLIITLCREAGDTDPDPDLVTGWEGNHSACCVPLVGNAAWGDPAALIRIRLCMGLPLTR